MLVYVAESRIAKDERGTPLDSCLATWFDRHGIVDPEELHLWEAMIHAVAMGHAEGTAERLDAEREAAKSE